MIQMGIKNLKAKKLDITAKWEEGMMGGRNKLNYEHSLVRVS